MSSPALAARYAAMYGAVFLTVGIYLPFWPVWLAAQGLSAERIGLLLALGTWIRILSSPAIAQIADRTGRAKATLLGCAVLTLLCFSGFFTAREFWAILAFQLLVNVFHPAMIPLTETQTMAAAIAGRLDYGRVRLWGSLSFILGTLGAGWLLTGRDPGLILPVIVGTLALNVLAALVFPGRERAAAAAPAHRLWVLFANRRFVLFFAATSLLAASHAVYYGFSALHWRAAGLSAGTIGWLWAEGVIAEVVMFAFAGRLVARIGPHGLLAVAAAGGIVRWLVLGATADLAALVAVQALHAATFGAAHLGAMHFLARHAPAGLAASAQALYSAVSGGFAIGLAMLASGWLYTRFGGGAFSAMAVLSAAGGLFAVLLARAAGPTPSLSPRA